MNEQLRQHVKLDNSGQPTGPSVVIRATPPAGTEIAAKD